MLTLRLLAAAVVALSCMVVLATGASGAPKTGCPVGTGWNEMTVEDAAARVWPALLDQSPWEDELDFQESAVRPYDRNEDGSICLKIMWGEALNPNANWFGVEQFLPRDNTANASN
jgi:hypothetical protein